MLNLLRLTGELQSVDGYMNIALEKTAEYVNGQLRRNYGDAFVRGNNGTLLSLMFEGSNDLRSSHVHICRLLRFDMTVKHSVNVACTKKSF